MSNKDIECRFPMPGAIEGSDWVLRYDGRVVELFNLYSGGSSRFPFPETRVLQTEPNKKNIVTFKVRSSTDNGIIDLESRSRTRRRCGRLLHQGREGRCVRWLTRSKSMQALKAR